MSIFLIAFVSSFNSSSANYKTDIAFSNGGFNASSSSYKTEIILGAIGGNASSSSYKQTIGFFVPTMPVAAAVASTPAATSSSSATSGGGGGGGSGGEITSPAIVREISNLEIVPNSFGITATVGRESSAKFSARNKGSADLTIQLSDSKLTGIVQFFETSFVIKAGETKTISFKIMPLSEPGIYTGKIVLSSEGKKFEIPFALNVNSELSLFDISVDIANQYKIIKRGQNIIGQITLLQVGLQDKTDVQVTYTIKDFDGNVYSTSSETFAVLKQKSYEHNFKTSNLQKGNYIMGVELIYSGGVATASHQFEVTDALLKNTDIIILLVEAVAIIFILIILVIIARGYKIRKNI